MPTIDISGSGATPGALDPAAARSAAWSQYEAQRAIAQGRSDQRSSEVEKAYRQRGDPSDKARQAAAAWRSHDLSEARRVRDESRLLSREEALERRRTSNLSASAKFVETQRKLDVASQRQFAKAQALQKKAATAAGNRNFNWSYADAVDQNRAFDARRRSETMAARNAERHMRADAQAENQAFDARKRARHRADRQADKASRAVFAKDYASAQTENAERDRLDPYAYAARQVAGLGASGGNWFERREARARLDQVEALAQRRMQGADPLTHAKNQRILDAVGEARAGMAGEELISGGGGFMGKGGPAAAGAEMAWRAAKFMVQSPFIIASKEAQLMEAARPFTDMVTGAADLGTAGGFKGSDLSKELLPTNGVVPEWMLSRGLTRQRVMELNGAFGISPLASPTSTEGDAVGQVRDIAKMAADAHATPFLGGMDESRYAQSMGVVAGLTDPRGKASLTAPTGYTLSMYLRDLQRVQESATEKGLDKSQVMGSIESLMKLSASSGRGFVDPSGDMRLQNRLMTSGDPNMRSGAGVLSAAAGIDQKIAGLGLGGDTVATQSLSIYMGRHGGLPKTQAALEKFLGVKRDSLPASSQLAFDNSLKAAQDGSTYWFASSFQPLMGRDRWADISNDVTNSLGLPLYMSTPIMGAMSGGGGGFARAYATGSADMPPAVGKGWAGVPDDIKRSIMSNADRNKQSPAELAAVLDYESGGSFSQFGLSGKPLSSGTGAFGVGQVTETALKGLQEKGIDRDITYAQVVGDADTNIRVASDYLAMRKGPRGYHGYQIDKNGVGPDEYFQAVTDREVAFDNAGEVQKARRSVTVLDQQQGQAGREASAPSYDVGGTAGQGLVVFSSKVADATTVMTHFAEAAGRAILALGGSGGRTAGQGMPPPGSRPVMPVDMHPPQKGY